MKQVHVFQTTVATYRDVKTLRPGLDGLILPEGEWNFDLEDCDNILKVETLHVPEHAICSLLEKEGYTCIALPD